MDLSTQDILKTKLLDVQENVRDFQEYAKRTDDREVIETFRKFANEAAMEAKELQQLIDKYSQKDK
ncbi:rubrerythrin [Clostridium acetobutylicum]|uniref:Uncharacterized protein n=1 Tax=Clostridium acetobutylicum (strain ATCC 824 / DSM 792 / JCM 1419 / IAM 19013 / LMG 5710 / NBRC 13948 / NRRL B-527 / VKM B-1787 / 2291 / W) TaxID=272562 RepID=Q97IM3_CLOAB|nr:MULTISPECIES: hypothetical protein [Clostridium]AAK79584.1 Hypothetical protein CA_C1617 [Clostridium acetobutylicum ATCC 824]ADZ20668.1 Conserved hypothetical protein [Clostridium acetobutylicum EA 2018]AEI31897.1 hypothetical protein SMB_G1642 [Clostridium acetobutylicum DSM 1731]AWV79977.1 hypothetical protein DK921_07680 [Clostridium acetobutylicum]KHD34456.1 hypothetical protein NL50_17020 [Clostridium acetobutylicum]